MPLVYDELKRMATGHLRTERRDHTLQPTALVHEAYLRIVHQGPGLGSIERISSHMPLR